MSRDPMKRFDDETFTTKNTGFDDVKDRVSDMASKVKDKADQVADTMSEKMDQQRHRTEEDDQSVFGREPTLR